METADSLLIGKGSPEHNHDPLIGLSNICRRAQSEVCNNAGATVFSIFEIPS